MRSFTSPLALGLLAMLSACTPPAAEYSVAEAPKTLKVDYLTFRHDAGFLPGAAALTPQEIRRLDDFLDDAQVVGGSKVYLQASGGDRLAAQRSGAIVKALTARGVGAVNLPDLASGPVDRLTVTAQRYVVTPPDCPDWSRQAVENHANALPSNYGCASLTNLALMVADPRDLVTGRPLGPADADPAIKAVERYRAGKVLPLRPTGDTQPFPTQAPTQQTPSPAPTPGQN